MTVSEQPRIVTFELPADVDDLPDFARRCMMHALEISIFGSARELQSASPLDRRDDAIRAALAIYDGAPSRRAKTLAADWNAYASNGWLRERHLEELPTGVSDLRRLWHRMTRLHDGRALRWQQIFNIGENHRGETF